MCIRDRTSAEASHIIRAAAHIVADISAQAAVIDEIVYSGEVAVGNSAELAAERVGVDQRNP